MSGCPLAESAPLLDPIIVVPSIVIAAVAASWLADKLRVPSVLTLLAVGLTVGPGVGLIQPEVLFGDLLTPMVSVAVGVILFEGGLSLRIREVEGSHRVIWSLVTVGVLVTWAVGTLAAWAFTGLGFSTAVVLGAILVVSGPTVVGPVLRTVRPSRRVSAILKWESIFIDPVGAMLAVTTFNIAVVGHHALQVDDVALAVLAFVADGAVSGGLLGLAAVFVLRRHWVPEHLVSLFGLAVALAAFLVAEAFVHESGLLATTVAGVVMSNHPRVRTESILTFSEDLRVLLIGVLFIVLSARLTREQILALGWGGLALVAVLVIVGRPLAVWISTLGSDVSRKERLLLAGVAPRGIVAASIASVFGLQMERAGIPGAELVTPLAFAVIVATVLLYGLGAGPLARRLQLASSSQQGVLVVGGGVVERAIAGTLHEAGFDVIVATTNRNDERRARMAGMRAFHGNVLDEHIDLRMELSGIGRLFALTPNDEVNTLATRRFAGMFGSAETYQLAPTGPPAGVDGGAADLGGRLIFADDLDYHTFKSRLEEESIVSKTLTERFDLETFRERHGPNATLLFSVRRGRLRVSTVEDPSPLAGQLQVGDRLFWLGTPELHPAEAAMAGDEQDGEGR